MAAKNISELRRSARAQIPVLSRQKLDGQGPGVWIE